MRSTEKLALSVVVITLNEEANIGRCLKSVPFAKEIVVLDSESQDRTREIAESLGAKVVVQKFKGYRQQKADALALATQRWILSLDADEVLSPELQNEICEMVQASSRDGFRVPRCSFYLGRWIRHGGWYPDYQTRLFKREKGSWAGGGVHEVLKVNGRIGTLRNDLHHFVFKNLEDQIDTNNEYSTLGAKDLYESGKNFYRWQLVLKPLQKFIDCYFRKLGFLDGAPGFIIALGAAQSVFLKYSKFWELKLKSPGAL
jgi:glycosyltransferase involved in cell wall biosynthesis